MQIKIAKHIYNKLIKIKKLENRILKITYPNEYHNKRLLKLEKIKYSYLQSIIL